jgi:four helix bundle protein
MPYERFRAWHACHELALATYRITESLPTAERYGLSSQMRRAAFSAAANIAEGAAKRGRSEFGRFLDIALGSLSELSYAGLLAKDLKLINDGQWEEFTALSAEAGRLTMALYKAVRRVDGPMGRPQP